jgi:hypothetical protein
MAEMYSLPRGPRVRLRMATPRDESSIRKLIERGDVDLDQVDVARLVRFDPRTRVVVCATALLGSRETIIGVGALKLIADEPELLVTDRNLTDGLDELLRRALVGRVSALQRARAA